MNKLFLDKASHLEHAAKKDLHALALELYRKGAIELEVAQLLGTYNDIKTALLSGRADFISISKVELEEISKTLDYIEELINE